ncbi:MAG: hypothetical protein ABIH04_02950 [Planctomycetota bacterium]
MAALTGGDVLQGAFHGAFFGGLTGGLSAAATYRANQTALRRQVTKAERATHRHHGTPKEVIRQIKDPVLQRQIMGKKGMPNRVRVPERMHIDAHRGGLKGLPNCQATRKEQQMSRDLERIQRRFRWPKMGRVILIAGAIFFLTLSFVEQILGINYLAVPLFVLFLIMYEMGRTDSLVKELLTRIEDLEAKLGRNEDSEREPLGRK